MNVNTRTVPKDELSFDHEGYSVHVYTHRQQVMVSILKDGKLIHAPSLTVDQFISLLMRDARQ